MSVVSKNRRNFFSAKAAIIIQSVLKIKILPLYSNDWNKNKKTFSLIVQTDNTSYNPKYNWRN